MTPPVCLSVPGYTLEETIHVNESNLVVIERLTSKTDPNIKVVCKGSLVPDDSQNQKILHEYNILTAIHNNFSQNIGGTGATTSTSSSNAFGISSGSGTNGGGSSGGNGNHNGNEGSNSGRTSSAGSPTPISMVKNAGTGLQAPRDMRRRATKNKRLVAEPDQDIRELVQRRIIKPVDLVKTKGSSVLILEDFGGQSLRRYGIHDFKSEGGPTPASDDQVCVATRKLCLEEILDISLQLSEALDIIHRCNVIHKDINPDNIVVRRVNDVTDIQIIDFNLAEIRENLIDADGDENPRPLLHGTLAYMSPEQTGRLVRTIDYRTDFYSLGVTLWELLIGRPPFIFPDSMYYVHAHIAKEIDAPHQLDPTIPLPLSEIVQKLVQKNADDRYHSSMGLRADFLQCVHQVNQFKQRKGIPVNERLSDDDCFEALSKFNFVLGIKDYRKTLKLTAGSRLFGRSGELEVLKSAFARVCEPNARAELVFVCGRSGVGKSSLVKALGPSVIGGRGFYITGHCAKDGVPFGGYISALNQLRKKILAESNESIDEYKARIKEFLSPMGLNRLQALVPEISVFLEGLGSQDTMPSKIDPQDCIHDMALLIAAFSRPERPLAMYLEDSQDMCEHSAQLLDALMIEHPPANFMLILSCLDEEASSDLKAQRILHYQNAIPRNTTILALSPLTLEGIHDFLKETLKPTTGHLPSLAALVERKTMGNPLHIIALLRSAERERYIYFDDSDGAENNIGWKWDLAGIESASDLSQDVINQAIERITKLPPKTKEILQIAACVGDNFDLRTLCGVTKLNVTAINMRLWPCNKEGIVVPLEGSQPEFELAGIQLSEDPERAFEGVQYVPDGLSVEYKFCHSRIREETYRGISEEMKRKIHLNLGRLWKQEIIKNGSYGKGWTETCQQYMLARDLIQDEEEKLFVASTCVKAASTALTSTVIEEAKRMISFGLSLVTEAIETWPNNLSCVLFELHYMLGRAYLSERNFVEAEKTFRNLMTKPISTEEKLKVTRNLSYLLSLINKMKELNDLAEENLKHAGISVPTTNDEIAIALQEEKDEFEHSVDGKTVDDLLSGAGEPKVEDEWIQFNLTCAQRSALRLGSIKMMNYFGIKSANFAIKHGFGKTAAEGFGVVCNVYTTWDAIPDLKRFSVVKDVWDRLRKNCYPESAIRAILFGIYSFGFYFSADEITDILESCMATAVEMSDSGVIMVAVSYLVMSALHFGWSPIRWQDFDRKYRSYFERYSKEVANSWVDMMAVVDSLVTGVPPDPVRCKNASTSTTQQQPVVMLTEALFNVLYNPGRLWDSIKNFKSSKHALGAIIYTDVYMLEMIALANDYDRASEEEKVTLGARMDFVAELITQYTAPEPREHLCKRYIALAERCRVLGQIKESALHFESALAFSRERGLKFHEALATELLGMLWLNAGVIRTAKLCIMEAFHLWSAWGSEGKCRQILDIHGELLDGLSVLKSDRRLSSALKDVAFTSFSSGSPSSSSPKKYSDSFSDSRRSDQTNTLQASKPVDMDLNTLLKVAQSIRNETSLDELLRKIMRFVVVNAGATKGALILQEGGRLLIEAYADFSDDNEKIDVLESIPVTRNVRGKRVPLSVVYYVYRSRDTLLLNNAISDPTYGQDSYITEYKPLSILCCPVIHHSNVTGIVYLENHLQMSAFAQERVTLIQSLMPTMSISIENARLTKTNTELTAKLKDSAAAQADGSRPKYTIDAPVQRAIDILQTLKNKMASEGDPVVRGIDFILKTLTSSDLFVSSIDEINDEQGRGIDKDTKSWIENSLLQKVSTRSRQKDEQEIPIDARFNVRGISNGMARSPSAGDSALGSNDGLAASADGSFDGTETPLAMRKDSPGLIKEIDYFNNPEVTMLLEDSNKPDFDVFKLGELTMGRPLYYLAMHFLYRYGLIEHFNLNETVARAYFTKIEDKYRPLPYHNSYHAADVLYTVNVLILSDPALAENFTKLEIFGAFLASAVHDVDHPGVNNNFLVQSSHPLAIFYNDISVLEYHHASKAFEIAQAPETDIFAAFKPEHRKELRKLIIAMVVATDMSKHFEIINKLKSKISTSALKLDESADRAQVLEIAIKCADLNNPAKPLEQCKKWAFCVLDEFFKQGDRERVLGLPVSIFMDRNDTNIPKCQIGFIDILVSPLFEVWSQCITTDYSRLCMENISLNRQYWDSILNKPEAIPTFIPADPAKLTGDPFQDGAHGMASTKEMIISSFSPLQGSGVIFGGTDFHNAKKSGGLQASSSGGKRTGSILGISSSGTSPVRRGRGKSPLSAGTIGDVDDEEVNKIREDGGGSARSSQLLLNLDTKSSRLGRRLSRSKRLGTGGGGGGGGALSIPATGGLGRRVSVRLTAATVAAALAGVTSTIPDRPINIRRTEDISDNTNASSRVPEFFSSTHVINKLAANPSSEAPTWKATSLGSMEKMKVAGSMRPVLADREKSISTSQEPTLISTRLPPKPSPLNDTLKRWTDMSNLPPLPQHTDATKNDKSADTSS
ncbi:hypothetical protein HDU76_000247 [Blyttiomyces sp. JEL0837]|nr:hypothetical protein HDU76_000247 [Blyttiomyces sp. JEL0837]